MKAIKKFFFGPCAVGEHPWRKNNDGTDAKIPCYSSSGKWHDPPPLECNRDLCGVMQSWDADSRRERLALDSRINAAMNGPMGRAKLGLKPIDFGSGPDPGWDQTT